MALKQEFKYTIPEGKVFIDINDWIFTQSKEEQDEFHAAVSRQVAIRQSYIDAGLMQIVKSTTGGQDHYEWADDAVLGKPKHEYKEYDDVWVSYWNKYLEDTGIKFESVETEI